MLMPRNCSAIILAAGKGNRAATEIPKQYMKINGRPLLEYSLHSFINSRLFTQIILVIARQDEALCRSSLPPKLHKQIKITFGADSRQASTWQALSALADNPPDYVFIHDAARPFISYQKLQELQQNLQPNQGVSLALRVSDTIKKINQQNFITENIDRKHLYAAQTPQAFPFSAIFKAHQQASAQAATDFTDDSALATYYGLPVKLLPGNATNIKLTWKQDFQIAEFLAQNYQWEE